jgi:hypothetical protein
MKYIIHAILFSSLLILTACGSSEPVTDTPEAFSGEEQEFVLSPDTSSLETAAISTRTPRLVVRLSIKPELDASGQPTGKRYGQAAFFWSDKGSIYNGSDLTGGVRVILRELNDPIIPLGEVGSIVSNRILTREPEYQGHVVKTQILNSTKPLCVEVRETRLTTSNNMYAFISNQPIILCQKQLQIIPTDMGLSYNSDMFHRLPLEQPSPILLNIINYGPHVSRDVYIKFTLSYELNFIEEQSSKFDCSVRSLSNPYYNDTSNSEEVTCYTSSFSVGLIGLPITVKATDKEYYGLGHISAEVSTSNTDNNIDNNSQMLFILLD